MVSAITIGSLWASIEADTRDMGVPSWTVDAAIAWLVDNAEPIDATLRTAVLAEIERLPAATRSAWFEAMCRAARDEWLAMESRWEQPADSSSK